MSASELSGKSVIVTGGGSGIGAACAKSLAQEGASVMICGRTAARLEETCERLTASSDGRIDFLQADVTKRDDVRKVVEHVISRWGGLHGVVANAGGGAHFRPLHLQREDRFLDILNSNILGAMFTIRETVTHLAASGGSFVAVSSIAASTSHRYFGAYTVAKAGIDQMIRTAADEYGAAGVRFNSVRPGFVTTELMESIDRDGSVFESYLSNTPLGGTTEPREVASLVRFLIGNESARITGQSIAIDGGQSLRSGPDFSPFVRQRFTEDEMLGLVGSENDR